MENLKPISITDYQKTSWKDGKGNPLNAANLNHIEEGIDHVNDIANKLNSNVTTLDTNVKTLDTNIKNLKLSDMIDDTINTVILDGGNGKPTTASSQE